MTRFHSRRSSMQMRLRTHKEKKIKFSSYIMKFRRERLDSHLWLSASLYMVKYLHNSSYIRKPYDFATISSEFPYMWGKFRFFYQCIRGGGKGGTNRGLWRLHAGPEVKRLGSSTFFCEHMPLFVSIFLRCMVVNHTKRWFDEEILTQVHRPHLAQANFFWINPIIPPPTPHRSCNAYGFFMSRLIRHTGFNPGKGLALFTYVGLS